MRSGSSALSFSGRAAYADEIDARVDLRRQETAAAHT